MEVHLEDNSYWWGNVHTSRSSNSQSPPSIHLGQAGHQWQYEEDSSNANPVWRTWLGQFLGRGHSWVRRLVPPDKTIGRPDPAAGKRYNSRLLCQAETSQDNHDSTEVTTHSWGNSRGAWGSACWSEKDDWACCWERCVQLVNSIANRRARVLFE